MSSDETDSNQLPRRTDMPAEQTVRQPSDGSAASARLSNSAWVALAIVGPIAIFLAWRVFTLGMADVWVGSDPARALYWRPGDPEALFAAADDEFLNHKFPEAKTLSSRTLAHYPLDGRGYRELGGIADFLGDHGNARHLFDVALRYAPRDVITRSKLVKYDLLAGQTMQAMHQVDMMMRIRPEMMPELMPRLSAISANPAVLASLGKILMTRPPWREYFLATLAAAGSDPDAIDRVFASRGGDDPLPVQPPLVGTNGASLNPDASSGYTEADLLINRQIADRRWGIAYVNWVGTLSPAERTALGNIYDGQFSFPPSDRKIGWLNLSNKGFGWQVPDQGTGFDVLIAPRTQYTTDNVLQVTFDGLTLDYLPVKQLLVLSPGHYRLTGMGQAGAMTSEDGLEWVVACAEGKQQVIAKSSEFTGDVQWSAFQMDFDVPDTDCGGQWLRLDLVGRSFKGQPLEGGVVFDDLQIVGLGTEAPAPADIQDPNSAPTTDTDATR